MLTQGLRWGVGTGSTIRIVEDDWIPNTPAYMVTSLEDMVNPTVEGQTVDTLIDSESHTWNEDRLRETFHEGIVQNILSVLISSQGGHDYASWPHTKNGRYSVRSAYNMARANIFHRAQSGLGRGLSSRLEQEEKGWKKIWAVHAPQKMKIVLWRLAHDCLPTGYQLCRRHIPTSDSCIFCNRMEKVETTPFSVIIPVKCGRVSKRYMVSTCVAVSSELHVNGCLVF
jgi:hypothetical protein